MQAIQCQAELESRYAILLQESQETKQFKAEVTQFTKRLEKEAAEHAEEKKGFKEVLDRLEKDKSALEVQVGTARRDFEKMVLDSKDQLAAKDAHIARLEQDLKAAYAEVAIQKLKADQEAAAAVQARKDAEGALERGRVEGASQAEASYNKSFDEALPLIQDDVFTTAWGLAMDLLSVTPEDPRRKNVPLPSKQQAEEEEAEEHAEEKKGFKEVLDRLEKEKADKEAELGKARRDYEDVVRE